ncbi:hypothetical protein MINTMi198_15280 [Mycobacterium intracellulare M.i.198]|nr:hypothetical protein MINTMi198_15280 [Mycobacterium intracellulare M.i.198]
MWAAVAAALVAAAAAATNWASTLLRGELGDPVGGFPGGRHARAGGDAPLGEVGHLLGQNGVASDPVVDLGDGGRALGDRGLGIGEPGDRGGPLPRRTPGRGEVPRVFGVDPLDQQRLGATEPAAVTGGHIERA